MAMKTLTTWLLTKMGDGATHIAHDLGGVDSPKSLFLFTVEFGLRGGGILGNKNMEIIEFDLKTASRPNISVNQEDINFYNYRAKVPTKLSFGTVKISFYEDPTNEASSLIWDYLKKISPLTTAANDNIITSGNGVQAKTDPSTIGPMRSGSEDGPISYMKVYHYYYKGLETMCTTYTYANPKIESVELTELSMSSSEVSEISASFTVEAIHVEHNRA